MVPTIGAAPHIESTVSATRRQRPYVVLAVVVALGITAAVVFSWVSRGKESTDDAQIDADAVTVSARVGGTVLKVLVKDNQQVKAGQLLVEIDPADLEAREKQAEAELLAAKAQADAADAQVQIVSATSKGGLSAARAQLSVTATSVASAGAQIEAARAALERAQAESNRSDLDLARAESLRKGEAVPQAQVDTANANAMAARAATAQAQAQLATAQVMKRTAQARIAEAQGRVEQSAPVDAQLAAVRANADLAHAHVVAAGAALTLAKLQLSYTGIEAPVDGVLSRLGVHEGQLAQAGQQVVIVVPNETYVIANFKETQVGAMRPGQRVEVSIDAYPGRSLEGKVVSTSPGTGARFSLLPADNASGNFVKVVQRVPVKIAWAAVPVDMTLAAGMSADVEVTTR
ncbi:MAG: HlyD family efflux transporter periplasmic adaptor subunit [Polyangiaceae bacterium]